MGNLVDLIQRVSFNATQLLTGALQDGWVQLGLAAFACVALHAWIFFKTLYSASHWALRADRHKLLKGLAYTLALPLRLLFSLISAVVATLVWAVVAAGVYTLVRVIQG